MARPDHCAAVLFGQSLDRDDFAATRALLSADCRYTIGEETRVGPEAITGSYEQNMLEGRKKLDKLEWGASRVEILGDGRFFVHFTDYLTHRGVAYTHRCKQRLTVGEGGQITSIEHMDDPDEQARLDAFYREVGLGRPAD